MLKTAAVDDGRLDVRDLERTGRKSVAPPVLFYGPVAECIVCDPYRLIRNLHGASRQVPWPFAPFWQFLALQRVDDSQAFHAACGRQWTLFLSAGQCVMFLAVIHCRADTSWQRNKSQWCLSYSI